MNIRRNRIRKNSTAPSGELSIRRLSASLVDDGLPIRVGAYPRTATGAGTRPSRGSLAGRGRPRFLGAFSAHVIGKTRRSRRFVADIVERDVRGRRRYELRFARLSIEHWRQRGLGSQVVKRPGDAPFERQSDRRGKVRKQPQRLRILVGVFVGILPVRIFVLRTGQMRGAEDQGGTQQNNRSPHTHTFYV